MRPHGGSFGTKEKQRLWPFWRRMTKARVVKNGILPSQARNIQQEASSAYVEAFCCVVRFRQLATLELDTERTDIKRAINSTLRAKNKVHFHSSPLQGVQK